MITAAQNEFLTRVGRGTPMGNLIREYWIPALISTELPEAGGPLARYIDPDNATGAYRVIRETIEDRAGLRKWRDEVQRDFRPVRWRQSAEAVVREFDLAAIDLRAAV